jgi:acetylornithine/succinyldiaminopimelate/putrescine aminotransferase
MDKTLDLLAQYESRSVTYIEKDRSWPIVWERARGMHVWDTSGKRYLDLTAAFGVANAGHANPRVVRAGQKQMGRLLHAMGDVHPHALKAQLVQRLSQVTFERWTEGWPDGGLRGRTILCNSGFEAVEVALKTAFLVTAKAGVICYKGGYHGLGYGSLNVTSRPYFRWPFRHQLRNFGTFVDWPDVEKTEKLARSKKFGAILVEPIQGRGGIRVPPPEFLPELRRICVENTMLLIVDEIFTGFGRTGKLFACEHSQTIPDVICLGKALTGGFPLSACVGKEWLMNKFWPPSHGEAMHTSTYLGHPVGCAMALAQIDEIIKLLDVARDRGEFLKRLCPAMRGMGLMAGLDVEDGAIAMRAIKRLLREGYIFLPEGDHGEVISFTPPLIISEAHIRESIRALQDALA